VASFTANSNTPTNPTGASAWLGPTTPFGAVFGSSQGKPYLNVPTAPGTTPSTTTFTFAGPTPAQGWGFALGDVDADQVTITATGPGGPLTAAQLGFQGVFNYCAVTPTPSACTAGPFTDVPTWDPVTSTLVGNVADTQGPAGWFRPSASITTLTFLLTPRSGIPIVQVWFAALTADIAGSIAAQTDTGPVPPPPGGVVELHTPTGAPVVDPVGAPIISPVAADGTYAFNDVTAAVYSLVVDPPPGYQAPAPIVVDASAGDVTVAPVVEQQVPPTTTTEPPTTEPPTTEPLTMPAQLPATGSSSIGPEAYVALLAAAGGALLIVISRRRARSS
jgi:hypothetical protein